MTLTLSTPPAVGASTAALVALVASPDAPARERRLAVDLLSRKRGARVMNTLVAALGDPDSTVASRAALALGRSGSPDALPGLTAVDAVTRPVVAARARFAAALIAHRFGVAGHELPAAGTADLLAVAKRAVVAEVGPASPDLARAAMAGVSGAMPAFRAGEPTLAIACGNERDVLVLAADAAAILAAPQRLLDRPWHLGQLAAQDPADGTFSPGLTLLSTPAGDHVDLGVYRNDGTLVYGGSGVLDGDELVAHLAAVRRPGAVAVSVQIRLGGGSLDLTVRSDTTAKVPPQHPEPG